MGSTLRRALGMWLVTAAGSVALVSASVASAEPPDEQCQQQDAPPPGEQQQCQDKGPGMPNVPDLPQNQDNEGNKSGRLSDTNCWMYPTGPVWVAPGAMPPPAPAGTQVPPCYHALGLQPTLPGT